MTQMCPKMAKLNLRRRVQRRFFTLRRCIRCFWDRILMCSLGKPIKYRNLPRSATAAVPTPPSSSVDGSFSASKISTLPPHVKYMGDDVEGQQPIHEKGFNLINKTLLVGGARISYSIWDVDGGEKSKSDIALACKDSVAILFMFDLTSRCTLNSVISWYQRARKWNPTAIPILIGTKFDDFIQLPIDLQWTIASQARAYAKALNATLFFSSATYNINVNKIFKFITAKLFDLPWTVERNLTIGEPIIDF
ncbi:Small GTPase superfamily, Rab type [Corchorus olitorius]|uniref:Small GTPase superfamily, Rab type n=1 Tax=Corchorus olitorius TaxID=93759 RepID=A0A1R3HPQ4_9ROSI|nr:Small GTPase superfamily, Rab type [Corchorus olitorius]